MWIIVCDIPQRNYRKLSIMSLIGKLVSELEINVAAEKYYRVFKEKAFHVPTISPGIFQQVEVHDGDWDDHGHGSVKTWKYTLGKYSNDHNNYLLL